MKPRLSQDVLAILARRGRIDVVRTLKSFPDTDFSINELARAAGVPVMTTWRAVNELKGAKIVKVRKVGNVRSVRITTDASTLRMLRLVEETDPQKAAARSFANMVSRNDWAMECRLFGSISRGEHIPGEEVDIAIVYDDGLASEEEAKATVARISERVLNETNVTVVPLCISTKEMSRKGGLAAELRDKETIWSRRL
ncbi:MAG: nucleotidyltransferase domain-containing protein [Methanobacteriota archaeon]|nr:MAG: nucleotidyltransferase domain-containing protein [Euryarchaeota archaeon]